MLFNSPTTIVQFELFNFASSYLIMSLKFHPLQLKSVRRVTEDAVEIALDVPEALQAAFRFDAGQYVTFKKIIHGEEVRRSYSLCSAPYETAWKVGIKRVEKGLFSNYAIDELKTGDVLEVMPPMGNFRAIPSPKKSRNLVLFAAGSGVTPILSIAKTVLKEEPTSSVTLFYGNKGFSSIMFLEELEALKNQYITRLRVIHVLSRESQGIPLQKGRIDAEKLEKLYNAFLDDLPLDDVYVCGPEAMILAVKSFFEAKGLDKSCIHFELFHSGLAKTAASDVERIEGVTCKVQLILDDDTLDFEMTQSDDNLLDAAQRAGADVPFACKGGVCCTCKAKILEGSASMRVNYALEPEEVEKGYILTCQAVPTSAKITVSFDE
jgi:ring-1,2-phenylacetyl-CoA epoxidase subunit PaaE